MTTTQLDRTVAELRRSTVAGTGTLADSALDAVTGGAARSGVVNSYAAAFDAGGRIESGRQIVDCEGFAYVTKAIF